MSGYIGPAPKASAIVRQGTGTGDGSTVVFPMGFTAQSDEVVIVTLDGVVQHTSAYSVSGSDCTFSVAPAGSVAIEFRTLQSLGFVAEVGDGTVNQSKIDTASINPIVQTVFTTDGEYASGSTVMPLDDTIPQITEGVEFMSESITPTTIGNKIRVEVRAMVSNSVNNAMTGALFRNSEADAVAAAYETGSTASVAKSLLLVYEMDATSLSTLTFSFRAGAASASTQYFNGAAARQLGGVMNSYIRITEIAQ